MDEKNVPIEENEAVASAVNTAEAKPIKKKMNLPNRLTILRILFVPVYIACMIYIDNPFVCGLSAGLVFVVTAATDFFDGSIARKYNLITNFGKFMDPVADKILVFTSFLTMAVVVKPLQNILVWTCFIVFLRELMVTSLRLVCANTEVGVVAASIFGKAKTIIQDVTIGIVLLEYALIEGRIIDTMWIASYILIVATIISTIFSGWDYLKTYAKYINPNE